MDVEHLEAPAVDRAVAVMDPPPDAVTPPAHEMFLADFPPQDNTAVAIAIAQSLLLWLLTGITGYILAR